MDWWAHRTQLAASGPDRRFQPAAVAKPFARVLRKSARDAVALCMDAYKAVHALQERRRLGPFLVTHVTHISVDEIRGHIGGGYTNDASTLVLELPIPGEIRPHGATCGWHGGHRRARLSSSEFFGRGRECGRLQPARQRNATRSRFVRQTTTIALAGLPDQQPAFR
jgi:hypothetical protein